MRIAGSSSLKISREEAWRVLTDPERITPLLPGGEIVSASEDTWRARLSAPTALGPSTFDFTFDLIEKRPEEYVRVSGHGYGSQNVIDLTADLNLSERDGGTEVRWESDVRLGGVLASLGQRSLPYVLRRQIEDVLGALDEQRPGGSV